MAVRAGARRPAVEAKPGGSAGDDSATPAGEDGAATAETAGGGYYVVTTDSQRRAWGLPDLAKEAGARDTAPRNVDAVERHHVVPVVDPAEAMDLLFEDGGNESDGQDGDGRAIGVRRSVRPDAVPVVNLKHGRGPVPDDVRAVHGAVRHRGATGRRQDGTEHGRSQEQAREPDEYDPQEPEG
ncbi:MAG: hypothetical protein OXG35_18900 [Acidobacteria bacterium]|nr:hypothetical protein [Acidobacteriota bacterium]